MHSKKYSPNCERKLRKLRKLLYCRFKVFVKSDASSCSQNGPTRPFQSFVFSKFIASVNGRYQVLYRGRIISINPNRESNIDTVHRIPRQPTATTPLTSLSTSILSITLVLVIFLHRVKQKRNQSLLDILETRYSVILLPSSHSFFPNPTPLDVPLRLAACA